MREPSGAPGAAGVLFPELLGSSEPAPPARRRGARLLKVLARVLLWSLITVGAFRGLMPDRAGPTRTGPGTTSPTSALSSEALRQHQAEAVAAAFLREYLTVGEDRAARGQRLGQLTVRGLDLRQAVTVPTGVAQYADLVVPAGSRPVAGGVEVTVVAHVLQVRPDGYRDGGTLAFVVPLAVRREGIGVAGRPRPTTVPFGSRLLLPAHRPCRRPCRGWLDGWLTRRWSHSSPATRQPSPASEAAGRHRPVRFPPAGAWRGRPRRVDRPSRSARCSGNGSRPPHDRTGQLLPTGPRPAEGRSPRGDGAADRRRRVALTPNPPDPNQRPDGLRRIRFVPDNTPRGDDPAVPGAATPVAARPLVGARRPQGGRLRRARMLDLSPRQDAPRPRRGWYAYRVTSAASLPSWAVEVALAVERPLDLHPEGFASHSDEGLGDPPGSRAPGAQVQAIVLLKATGGANWLAGIVEAAAEVEAAAGIRSVDADRLAESSLGARSSLLTGPPLPGLVPIPPAVAQAHLGASGARGLAAPLRRWRPPAGRAEVAWEAGGGAVLTCEGPSGVSAQAVVALQGTGRIGAIAPPPGGALVLRAWRTRGAWGAACGLVLGAAEARGLGREAQRVAAGARAEGWDAVVLHGMAALRVARAGDHRQMAPEAEARAASSAQVASLFEACLTAAGLGRPDPAAVSSWALAMTP